MKRLATILAFTLALQYVYGQTCCSGGVPLSGNIGLPVGEAGTWQISLTYDINTLKTLKFGDEKLEDQLRERKTHAILLEAGYTLSSKWSIDLFTSYIRQERHIFTFDRTQSTVTNGIGDAVFLLKYRITGEDHPIKWVLGAGPKIPLGSTSKTTDSGISLSADLQPGSGSWDGILWSTTDYSPPFRKSLTFTITSTWKINGKNKNYLGSIIYQFGNEHQLVAGIADRLAIKRLIIDPSLSFQYRRAARDRNNGQEIEATGGQWIFIRPAINIPVNRLISVNFMASLPIYSFVNNTQLTPTNRFTAGIFIKIQKQSQITYENP